jgi:hypothetical protein
LQPIGIAGRARRLASRGLQTPDRRLSEVGPMIRICTRFSGVLALAVLFNTGCVQSPIRLVQDSTGLAGNEHALIAFSVDSVEPFALRSLELVAPADPALTFSPREVPVHPDEGTGQLFLYEIPVEGVQFGVGRFKYKLDWWETVEQGPVISVVPGAVTYVGRIQVHSIAVDRYSDTGRNYPAGARIVVTDAGAEDLQRLTDRYPSMAKMSIRKAIPGSWGISDTTELRFVPGPGSQGGDARFGAFEPTDLPKQSSGGSKNR